MSASWIRPLVFIVAALWLPACRTEPPSDAPSPIREHVGRVGANRTVTPVNQALTPAGKIIELPGLRPQALALSPDGRLLVTSGKTSELVVIDPATGEIRQRVELPSDQQGEPQPDVVSPNILQPDKKGQVSFTGLAFSPDGRRLFLSNVNGSIKVFTVSPAGVVTPSHSVALPTAPQPTTITSQRVCTRVIEADAALDCSVNHRSARTDSDALEMGKA